MFAKRTTLVIGAGTGFDIAMPTGADLVTKIKADVNIKFEGGTRKVSGDDLILLHLRRIARERKSDLNTLLAKGRNIASGIHHAGSIDTYIHKHDDDPLIALVGRLAIIKSILEYERRSDLYVDKSKWPLTFQNADKVHNSWLSVLWQLLHEGVTKGNLDQLFENLAS